jgi:hypothetical protein
MLSAQSEAVPHKRGVEFTNGNVTKKVQEILFVGQCMAFRSRLWPYGLGTCRHCLLRGYENSRTVDYRNTIVDWNWHSVLDKDFDICLRRFLYVVECFLCCLSV